MQEGSRATFSLVAARDLPPLKHSQGPADQLSGWALNLFPGRVDPMKVSELIEKLRLLPQDLPVYHANEENSDESYGDTLLEDDEVEVAPAQEKDWRPACPERVRLG